MASKKKTASKKLTINHLGARTRKGITSIEGPTFLAVGVGIDGILWTQFGIDEEIAYSRLTSNCTIDPSIPVRILEFRLE